MAIKNYTTEIDVHKSLSEIQSALALHGARKIMIDYNEKGRPIGIAFGIETIDGAKGFLLPANVDGVFSVFQKQKLKAGYEQAERTAWRNIRDWVLAQMAIIEAGQVDIVEVFLPYLTDGKGNTVYQLYKNKQLLLCSGEK